MNKTFMLVGCLLRWRRSSLFVSVILDYSERDRHPGGSGILEIQCGTDATAAYSNIRNHNPDLLQKLIPDLLLRSAC